VQKSAALVKLIYDLFYTWHESFECLVVKLILWPAHGNGTLHATVGVKDWKSNACNATQIIAVSERIAALAHKTYFLPQRVGVYDCGGCDGGQGNLGSQILGNLVVWPER
jgi:hypothetical protein